MKADYPAVFSPLTIKSLVLKNRIVMPPMATWFATSCGEVTPRLISYHRERAAGGVGLNIVEFTVVDRKGKLDPLQLGIYDDAQIPALTSLAQAVHEAGGKIAIQLAHAGRRARSSINGGSRPWGPSPIAELGGEIPSEMSEAQIRYIQECFQKAAGRAKQAGFDAVEIHTAHGYIIHQFLSALSNRRTDQYGGGLENRARFAVETVARVREAVGSDFPIFCRVSGDEFVNGGASLAEAKQFVKILEKAGADLIHVSAGVLESAERTVPPLAMDRGCNIYLAKEIKQQLTIPVIGVGRIKTLEEAEKILQEGTTDLVGMGRALIADPELLPKSKAGDNIRPCIACNQGCIERLYYGLPITCLVNARVGREFQMPGLTKAPTPKKIAVVGGGPGGLEFARVAAERGHKVTLYEKEKELGGRFKLAAKPPKKGEIAEFIDYLSRALTILGVDIKTDTCVKPEELLQAGAFDEVVIAAGGEPISLPMVQAQSGVVFAEEVLQGKVKLGKKIVIIGGGMVGCETADLIAQDGRQVIVLEQLAQVANDVEARTKKLLLQRLESHRVEVLCNTKVEGLEKGTIVCSQGGIRCDIEAVDTIILAVGYKANSSVAQLRSEKIHKIGDCVQARKAISAVHEGFLLGATI